MDMQAFQTHGGLNIFINRLEVISISNDNPDEITMYMTVSQAGD